MNVFQVFSIVTVSWLSCLVTVSYQHGAPRYHLKTPKLTINVEPMHVRPKDSVNAGRNMYDRPAMVPLVQLKKPEELMSKEEFKVMKLKNDQARRLRFGGQKTHKMPSQLTVTDELFFELEIENFHGPGENLRENITIACFGGLTPITCLNFVSITKGFRKGKNRMLYKNGLVSKVVRDFMVQMGDTREGNNDSIFGKNFADESFAISHNHAGWIGMANFGQDSNGSQFYVLLKTARWLDGKHVLFAKVIHGMDLIQKIGEQDTDVHNAPLNQIKIVNCGSLKLKKPYVLTESQFNTDGDIERRDGDEIDFEAY